MEAIGDRVPRSALGWLLRLAGGGAALLMIAALLRRTVLDLHRAREALGYPFGIDYGEGIVWQQALLIPGPRMYGPIDNLPFIVFHYPPVFHLTVRAVMALGVDPLAAGRAVSIGATAAILVCIAWLVTAGLAGRASRSALIVGAATGALLPLSFAPVESWFLLMRVDMLAIALSFVGVVLTVLAAQRPAWLLLAMPVFVLSVYAKQTEIAGPAAALAVLVSVKPRAAILAGLGGAVLGLVAFVWLEWLSAGGFARHILAYNVNSFSFEALRTRLSSQAAYAPLLLVVVVGLVVMWSEHDAAAREPDVGTSGAWVVVRTVSLWLLISVVMLAMLGKAGAYVNYFIEVACVCSIAAGLLAGLGWRAVSGETGPRGMVWQLSLVALAMAVAVGMTHRHRPLRISPELTAIQEALVREIAAQDRPVLSEDMVLPLRAGREVPIETAIFTELARTGQWDQRRLLDLIAAHTFGFVITQFDCRYPAEIECRYTPEMLGAIARAYPRVEVRGPYTVHYPNAP